MPPPISPSPMTPALGMPVLVAPARTYLHASASARKSTLDLDKCLDYSLNI